MKSGRDFLDQYISGKAWMNRLHLNPLMTMQKLIIPTTKEPKEEFSLSKALEKLKIFIDSKSRVDGHEYRS